LFLLSAWFIYHQVFLNKAIQELFAGLVSGIQGEYPIHKAFQLVLILFLMGLNWITEARKWQLLVQPLEPMPLIRSATAVLSGISLGFFTPNRIGEYPARSLMLRKTGMADGILVSMAGSLAQLLVTIMTGCISLVFLLQPLFHSADIHPVTFYLLSGLLLLLPILLPALYLNLPGILRRLPAGAPTLFSRLMQKLTIFTIYRRRELLAILLLSAFRYLVFTTQYFLLLRFFGIKVSFFEALALIAVVYFITTMIPSVALTELGIRGSVAIWVFSVYQPMTGLDPHVFNAAVLSASVTLWLVNIGIPAMVGALLIFKLKFRRG
jgi:uncharacterized membrane protein YbhN (UPF0104 family)